MADISENEDTGPPATPSVVPLKHLREHVGAIARRVNATGESIVISDHGRPLAAIVPIPRRTGTSEAATRFDDPPAPPLRLRRPDPDDDDDTPPTAAAA